MSSENTSRTRGDVNRREERQRQATQAPIRVTTSNDSIANDPNAVGSLPLVRLDYTLNKDVDYYIQFNRYKYKRLLNQNQFGAVDPNSVNVSLAPQEKLAEIRLPLLSGVSHRYNGNFSNFNADIGYESLTNLAQLEIQTTFEQAATAIARGITSAASFGAENRGLFNNTVGFLSNPREETSFVGMGMRSHQFDFMLIPRNPEEARMIRNIIQQFKLAAHPENKSVLDQNGFLEMPDEFTIGFYSKSTQSALDIPPIPDCFLNGIEVMYNGNNQARFYKDNTAFSYRISLSFTEANALTRNDIIAGGF